MKARKKGSRSAAAATGKASGWEYRITRPLGNAGMDEAEWTTKLGGELSELGAEGWELCAQAPSGHYVFKRPK